LGHSVYGPPEAKSFRRVRLTLCSCVSERRRHPSIVLPSRPLQWFLYFVLHRRRLPRGNGGDCPKGKALYTAPPPPGMNWTRRRISSLFLCRKLHLFLGKSTKTAATHLHFLTPICTKSFVGWGFWGAYSVPPDP